MSAKEFWMNHVRSEQDVITYYQTYYPMLPDEVIRALAQHMRKATEGAVQLEDYWIADPAKKREQKQFDKWDFEKEIEDERSQALVHVPEVERDIFWQGDETKGAGA